MKLSIRPSEDLVHISVEIYVSQELTKRVAGKAHGKTELRSL